MPETVFPDVPAWPGESSLAHDASTNSPPLSERIMLDFDEDLAKLGIKGRIEKLLESAAKCPEKIEDPTTAGKAGDLVKMARTVENAIEEARERHNRPLIDARTALKSRADGTFAPLANAIEPVRERLNAFMQAESRKAAEAARIAAEEARKAEDAARARIAENTDLKELPPVRIEPPKFLKPVARGDLGAKVGTRKVWHHEIESVRQLPDRLLKHPKVIDALNIVIAAEIRGMGERKSDIKGVRMWHTDDAIVR